jgi:Phage-related minor tail protein
MNDLYALEVLINLADQMSGPINRPLEKLQQFEMQVGRADHALEQMQAGMGIAAVGTAIIAPFALATNAAMGFESAFADVKKVVGDELSVPGLKALKNDLLDLTDIIPRDASELTQIAAAAGQAGIGVNELTQFTADAAEVAVAFDIGNEASGQGLAVLRNNYKLNQGEVMLLTDAMNDLSNGMASSAADILNVTNRVSGLAAQSSLSGQEVAALASAMLSAGAAPEVVKTWCSHHGREGIPKSTRGAGLQCQNHAARHPNRCHGRDQRLAGGSEPHGHATRGTDQPVWTRVCRRHRTHG